MTLDDAYLLIEDPKQLADDLEDADMRMKLERQEGTGGRGYLEGNRNWD